MAYDTTLADRVRNYLNEFSPARVEEKRMFGGLAFLVNDKMCVNVSKDRLMCRFDPELTKILSARKGFQPLIMKGKALKGYCYVSPDVITTQKDLAYWIELCLTFNKELYKK